MSKWRERYKKGYITNDENNNYINVKSDYIKAESAYTKNEEQEKHSLQPEKKPQDNETTQDSKTDVNIKTVNTIALKADFKITNTEGYYPTTTDKAWELAEKILTNKSSSNKKLLQTMARKYKDTPNADFIKFYDDNGMLFIENAPSPKVDFNYGDEVQISYFVRD